MATSIQNGKRTGWELWLGLAVLALALVLAVIGFLRARTLREEGARKPGAPGQASQAAASGPGNYAVDTGPFAVEQIDFDLHDSRRDKDLPLRVYYPAGAVAGSEPSDADGPFPVIIFSHGAGGSRDVGPALLGFWASHGYVVFAPTHSDSIALARARGEKTGMADVISSFGTDPQLRISRVEDDKLIIDSLASLPAQLPELEGKLDQAHIGVGGHSAGAMTAVLIGGARMDMPVNGPGGPELEGLQDSRVDATMLLSGQGITPGPNGQPLGAINEDSWLGCGGPMMVMTGSLDSSSNTGQTAESRKDPYIFAPPGDKYLLFIEGAAHMSFTGKAAGKEGAGRGELMNLMLGRENLQSEMEKYDQGAIFALVQSNSLAYWDAYLKQDRSALAFLQSRAPAAAAGDGQLEYEWK